MSPQEPPHRPSHLLVSGQTDEDFHVLPLPHFYYTHAHTKSHIAFTAVAPLHVPPGQTVPSCKPASHEHNVSFVWKKNKQRNHTKLMH
jgi:hypothetical protein